MPLHVSGGPFGHGHLAFVNTGRVKWPLGVTGPSPSIYMLYMGRDKIILRSALGVNSEERNPMQTDAEACVRLIATSTNNIACCR
jgi:hypothetical protein